MQNEECRRIQDLLGWAEPLPDGDHHAKCSDCLALASEFSALDALLASEPTPLAPVGLAAAIRRSVEVRRRLEAGWVRLQTLWALAAMTLVVLVGSFGLPASVQQQTDRLLGESEVSVGAWYAIQDFLFGIRLNVGEVFGAALQSSPSPSWLLLAGLVPALFLLNWMICRPPQLRPVVS